MGVNMAGTSVDLKALFKRVMEICMPDLRRYYRVTRKARVVASYASDGKYYADVQPLRNDDTPDPAEPIIPKVEIPIFWGGLKRGIVCPPAKGSYCDLSYYDGDPNYPRISNIRWLSNTAPECGLDELIIQQEPGVHIKIDNISKVITVTPTNIEGEAGKDWTIQAGDNARITCGKAAAIEAGESASIKAPQIAIIGNQTSTGHDGGIGTSEDKSHRTHKGSYTLDGPQDVKGNVTVSGNITVSGTVTASLFVGPHQG